MSIDFMDLYGDIIERERPKSQRRQMAVAHRAKQFAPFAALKGFDDSIDETARIHEEKVEKCKSVF